MSVRFIQQTLRGRFAAVSGCIQSPYDCRAIKPLLTRRFFSFIIRSTVRCLGVRVRPCVQMEKPDAPGRLPGPGMEFTQTTDALGMISEGPASQGPAPLYL